ncbi:MAG TPA: hypothetical protein P5048_04545, partial [Chlamydiales bacterium]|nr:hypothetical protein [Chlamydiales bacterium]
MSIITRFLSKRLTSLYLEQPNLTSEATRLVKFSFFLKTINPLLSSSSKEHIRQQILLKLHSFSKTLSETEFIRALKIAKVAMDKGFRNYRNRQYDTKLTPYLSLKEAITYFGHSQSILLKVLKESLNNYKLDVRKSSLMSVWEQFLYPDGNNELLARFLIENDLGFLVADHFQDFNIPPEK